MRSYKVYFSHLDPNSIVNYIGPMNGLFNIQDKNLVQKRLNQKISARNSLDNFYEKLEQSILEEGIRNPITVKAGWIMESKWKLLGITNQNKKDLLFCDWNGGSRLYVAQKLCLPSIPCIILDYVGRFNHLKEITTNEELKTYFPDPPEKIKWMKDDLKIIKLPQVHMEP